MPSEHTRPAMDSTSVAERNYRQSENIRQENLREQRRVQVLFNNKNGLGAAHRLQLDTMSKEQKRLREDLARIKKSTALSLGQLPPRVAFTQNNNLVGDTSPETPRRSILMNTASSSSKAKPHVRLFGVRQSDDEKSKMQVVRRRSFRHILHENKRTEKALARFNESFPIDESGAETEHETTDGNADETVQSVATLNTSLVVLTPRPAGQSSKPQPNDHGVAILQVTIDDARGNITRRLTKDDINIRDDSMINPNLLTISSTPRDGLPPSAPPSLLDPINLQSLPSNNNQSLPSNNNQSLPSNINQAGASAQDHHDEADIPPDNTVSEPKDTTSPETDTTSPVKTKPQDSVRSIKAKFVLPVKKKLSKVDSMTSIPAFDSDLYNPDGSMRARHTLPNLEDSLREASRARYIRHKYKPSMEKELSVSDIFYKYKQQMGDSWAYHDMKAFSALIATYKENPTKG